MSERFKYYAFIFLASRVLLDLALIGIIYYETASLVAGLAVLPVCGVFYFFLYFGIKNEEFRGRYGRKVCLWREPLAYWLIVAFLVLFHLIITSFLIADLIGGAAKGS